MVVLLALLAATAIALGTVLQQRGALDSDPATGAARFLAQVVRRPVWLLGGLATVVGWVLQALALHWGSLLTVQAVMTLSLVIALPFGVWLTDQRITGPVWVGVTTLVPGLVLFLAAGAPESGSGAPSPRGWWTAGLVTAGLIGVLVRGGRAQRPGVRAAAFGAAAGLCYGFQAAVTKVLTGEVGGGLVAVLTGWEIYVLVGGAVVGLAVGQSALRTGALPAAMAATQAMTLLSSVALGLALFGESFAAGGHLVLPALGLALILAGVVLLARVPTPAEGPEPAAAQPVDGAGAGPVSGSRT